VAEAELLSSFTSSVARLLTAAPPAGAAAAAAAAAAAVLNTPRSQSVTPVVSGLLPAVNKTQDIGVSLVDDCSSNSSTSAIKSTAAQLAAAGDTDNTGFKQPSSFPYAV
jgi:hypothetical protein